MSLLFAVGLGTMTNFLETSFSLPVSLRGEEEEDEEEEEERERRQTCHHDHHNHQCKAKTKAMRGARNNDYNKDGCSRYGTKNK